MTDYDEDAGHEIMCIRWPKEVYKRIAEQAAALTDGDIPGLVVLIVKREVMGEKGRE